MKNWMHFSIIMFIFFAACKEDEDPVIDTCLQLARNPDWQKISFKTDFHIQLPDDYEFAFYGFEGPIFKAYNEDKSVSIEYNFCITMPVICEDYGEILVNPDKDTLTTYNSRHKQVTLLHRQDFCDHLVTSGILYYNTDSSAVGILYLYTEGVFKQAASVYYNKIYQSEVEQIFQTIWYN